MLLKAEDSQDDKAIDGPGPERGIVFQQPTLFPWKSVRDNVAHGPRMLGYSKAESREIADKLLMSVGLSGFGDRRTTTLSGGMQQRVGIFLRSSPCRLNGMPVQELNSNAEGGQC